MRKARFLTLLLVAALAFGQEPTLYLYTEESPPLNFAGTDGELDGIIVAIVRELQRRVGNGDAIELVPWPRGLAILDRKPNVFLFAMARTAERDPHYLWIGPLYENIYAFYSLAGGKYRIGSLEDAKKVGWIGVYKDDVRDQILTSAGFKNLYRAPDGDTLARMLFAKRLDLIASSPDGIEGIVEKTGRKVGDVELQFVFWRVQLYIGVSKSTAPGIVDEWNAALESMKSDGTLMLIFERFGLAEYFPGAEATPH